MRNLKRALSLALASVMLLGMMVVGTSAASYPDIDDNDNVEAIEVLNAVKVMIGDRGNFRPDAAVNRHEMATIMAKLVLGVDIADNYVGTHPFTDVFPWADKYVAACYENGLVAGTSATTFSGNKTLTAVEAAAMMLRALGYKDLSKGASDWRAPVTAMANQIRLFNGVASNPSEQLNRNQVAQLALNTLKSPMVNLKDNTISWTDGEGQIIMTGGGREYIALSSNEAYAKAINDTEKAGTSASQISGWTVELGEHLYNGKLKLNNNYLDVFGRPARHWEFDGKEIGSYIKDELMVMDKVGKVTGNDLYTLLGASTIKDYDTLVTIDGVANDRSDAKDILGYPNGAYFDEADMNRNNKAAVGKTGTGVLTQVFVDHEKDQVYVAVINTYLARADRDYDDKSEEATLTVYGIDEYRTSKEYVKTAKATETMKIQAEDFAGLETIKKDDPFLVTVADGAVQTIVEDEVLEGVTLTAFKKGDHVVSDGTEYKYTTTATYDSATLDNYTGIDGKTNLKDITYNIYLDAYGNLIGIKEIDAVKNYVFLAGIDVDGSNLYSKTATANALFLDGTSKTIKINLSKSKFPTHTALNNTNVVISGDALLNTWCTYTVSSDNVYTVTEAYATRVNPDHPSFKDINANPNNYPGGGQNNTKLAQSWQPAAGLKEDNYTVDVKRMRLHGTDSGDGSRYANVYGDSTSVYLTANLDELFNDSNSLNIDNTVTPPKAMSYGIIKDVDAVTTGVADVSIKVLKEEEARKKANSNGTIESQYPGATASGIYTLYDNEGIVIASVVIGEDDGVKDLVYVHTDKLDLESYNNTDDIWTWTRRVVFNGQETTLTEKGSEFSEMKDMKQFHWYEIKRNADGNVINVEPAWSALDDAFVYEYSKINTTVETVNEDTILYQTEDGPIPADDDGAKTGHDHYGFYKEKLNVIGTNTLAVETLSGSGIHFRDNVNVVLQYWNRNTEQTEIETGTGVDRLKSMVNFVNKNTETRDSAHPYYLSAVIEKGFATTIVIYDSFNSYNRPDTPMGTYELTLGGVLNSIYTTTPEKNSDVYIVNADGSITYVESNDDIATSTVNGYKRYTVPYNARIRIYDNDTETGFLPFFSPIKPILGFYGYDNNPTAKRAYIEFTVPSRLDNDKLTIRERMVTDGIYVGVESDAKATVTVTKTDGTSKTYKAGESVIVYRNDRITANTTAADAELYINGVKHDAPYSWKVDVDKDLEFIVSTEGGTVTPPDPTDPEVFKVTFTGSANRNHYTVKGLDANNEIKAGESFTITAKWPISVYVGNGEGEKLELDQAKTITPEESVTVKVNYWFSQIVGGEIIDKEVELTRMATARIASRENNSIVGSYFKTRFVGLEGMESVTLITKGVEKEDGSIVRRFGADLTDELLVKLNNALAAAAASGKQYACSFVQTTDQADIDKWNGEGGGVDVELPVVERSKDGGTFTVYQYDEKKPADSIVEAEVLKALKLDSANKVTWNALKNQITVTRANGDVVGKYNITNERRIKIFYNDAVIGSAGYAVGSTLTTETNLAEGTVLVGAEKGAIVGTAYTVRSKGVIAVTGGDKDLYFYDGIQVDKQNGLTFDGYRRGSGNRVAWPTTLTGDSIAVRPGTELYMNGEAGNMAGFRYLVSNSSDAELKKIVTVTKEALGTDNVPAYYDPFVVSTDLVGETTPKVDITEVRAAYKVVLHDTTDKVAYGAVGDSVAFTDAEYEAYIMTSYWSGANLVKKATGRDEGVTYKVSAAHDGGTADFVIDAYPAYQVASSFPSVIKVIKYTKDKDTLVVYGSDGYIGKGTKMYVWTDETVVPTSDVVTLTREAAKDDGGDTAYSFIVDGPVTKDDIKIGKQLNITWTAYGGGDGIGVPVLDNVANYTIMGDGITLTVTTKGSTEAPKVYWSSQASGSEVLSTNGPEGITVTGPTPVAGKDDQWTVGVANNKGVALTEKGTWYFVIEAMGIKTIGSLTIS